MGEMTARLQKILVWNMKGDDNSIGGPEVDKYAFGFSFYGLR